MKTQNFSTLILAVVATGVLTGCATKPPPPPPKPVPGKPVPPYTWNDTAGKGAPKIVVDLGKQRAFFFRGDVLVGYFTPETKNQPSQMDRIEAFGNVVIVTPNETVQAARGVYRIATETASLEGPVMITRGENQINGCRALVNMKTGVSRILSCEPGTGGGRVRGLLVPEKK